jgi:hypothetical protein
MSTTTSIFDDANRGLRGWMNGVMEGSKGDYKILIEFSKWFL